MNRIDLHGLAALRLRDAEGLLGLGQWSVAYYLAGYAVECGLKACIARQTDQHDLPDKERTLKSYSHKLDVLVEVAGLRDDLVNAQSSNREFKVNWLVASRWNEVSRYQHWSETEARRLFAAITHPIHGVLAWIQGHW